MYFVKISYYFILSWGIIQLHMAAEVCFFILLKGGNQNYKWKLRVLSIFCIAIFWTVSLGLVSQHAYQEARLQTRYPWHPPWSKDSFSETSFSSAEKVYPCYRLVPHDAMFCRSANFGNMEKLCCVSSAVWDYHQAFSSPWSTVPALSATRMTSEQFLTHLRKLPPICPCPSRTGESRYEDVSGAFRCVSPVLNRGEELTSTSWQHSS